MFKIICILLCILFEIPFAIKYIQAYKNFEITKQVSILVIMLLVAIIFFSVYKSGLFVIR